MHPFLHFFINGPSSEFNLGRINRSLRESVIEEIRRLDGDRLEDHPPEDGFELIIERAEKLYARKNCELLP